MESSQTSGEPLWRLVVVGGHTRSIGKTQLVCDVIQAFPNTRWIAGKITQYGHGVCARNGKKCDCAPKENICALNWESHSDTGTDSARFLAAGADQSFWLRTKQGHLAEGLPLLREALRQVAEAGNGQEMADPARSLGEGLCCSRGTSAKAAQAPCTSPRSSGEAGQDLCRSTQAEGGRSTDSWAFNSAAVPGSTGVMASQNLAVIVESNSLLQFLRPSLYFAVIDPRRDDFKQSAKIALDCADALVVRGRIESDAPPAPLWMRLPAKLLQSKPSVLQREGESLPEPLWALVQRVLEAPPDVRV